MRRFLLHTLTFLIVCLTCLRAEAGPASLFLAMPSSTYGPGDPFSLSVAISNPGEEYRGKLYVVLEAGGRFYYAPSWGENVESRNVRVSTGGTSVAIIQPFLWPEFETAGATLKFYAAVIRDSDGTLAAGPASFSWRYKPYSFGYTINPEALLLVGEHSDAQGNTFYITPNGRKLTPQGQITLTRPGPMQGVVSPDGRYLFLTHSSKPDTAFSVWDLTTNTEVLAYDLPGLKAYYGFAWHSAFTRFYVSDGVKSIWVFNWDSTSGSLTGVEDFNLPAVSAGLALTPDNRTLFSLSQHGNKLYALNARNGVMLGEVTTGELPFAVALHPRKPIAYVSVLNTGTVEVFDISNTADMKRTQSLPLGKNPEHLAVSPDGNFLYVCVSDEDLLAVIKTDDGSGKARHLRSLDLRAPGTVAWGGSPNAITFSEDGKRLYLAEGMENKITVLDLTLPSRPTTVGHIPTGWFPSWMSWRKTTGEMVVVNHKGLGYNKDDEVDPGAYQVLTIPSDAQLRTLGSKVESNNSLPGRLFNIDPARFSNPVPQRRGELSKQIKHVIMVVKENQTYDALLGAYPRGRGSATHQRFFNQELVNTWKLADEFAICDNYYTNAESSVMGHQLIMQSALNVYSEKIWASRKRAESFFGGFDGLMELGLFDAMDFEVFMNPATYPKNDNIIFHCKKHGVSIRNHGEISGMGKDLFILDGSVMHWGARDLPFINYAVKDVDKVAERIESWGAPGYKFPQLIYSLLPNDHGAGSTFGFPTYSSLVADNDEALGMLVDWVSKSPYWKETVILVTQDDPQGGRDQIDGSRTIFYAISPWAKRGYISGVRYSEPHFLATVEYLLGLPPMTIADEVAQPMYDLFTMTPDFTPYNYVKRVYPEEMNPPATRTAAMTKTFNWFAVDEVTDATTLIDGMVHNKLLTSNPELVRKEFIVDFNERWFELFRQLWDKKEAEKAELRETRAKLLEYLSTPAEPVEVVPAKVE